MPSILRQSSSFSGNKIALVSQGIVEEPSGLVRATVDYATSSANNDYWSNKFQLDSRPPIFPNILNKASLQRRSLYLGGRTVTKENGLVNINATYFGALQSARSGKNNQETTQIQTLQWKLGNTPATSTFKSKILTYVTAVTPGTELRFDEPRVVDLYVSLLFTRFYGLVAETSTQAIARSMLLSGYLRVEKEETNEVLTPSLSVRTTRYSLISIFQYAIS